MATCIRHTRARLIAVRNPFEIMCICFFLYRKNERKNRVKHTSDSSIENIKGLLTFQFEIMPLIVLIVSVAFTIAYKWTD